MTAYDVVIPTVGRSSLRTLLASLERQEHQPASVEVVRDEHRRGPAWARNTGWRRGSAPWVVFLDDDVVLPEDWSRRLMQDLDVPDDVGASQAVLEVPVPSQGRLTDDGRMTKGLEGARWATADMAYRRTALTDVGGFDEAFPRAFREDSDLALRVEAAGWRLVRGHRVTVHPLREDGPWASLRRQRGNADDVLMRVRHGRDWRARAGAPAGRLRQHEATVAVAALAVGALLARRPRAALVAAVGWAGLTARFAAPRVLAGPGPGQDGWRSEALDMAATSVAIPFAATGHHLRGLWIHRVRPLLQHPGLHP